MQARITTRVIIFKGNKVLLSRGRDTDFWYPGGGKWEDNVTIEECCIREVMEEIGQKVKIIDIIYVEEFYLKDGSRNLELFFLAEHLPDSKYNQYHRDKDPEKGDIIKENRWFSKADMKKVTVYPIFMREQFWKDIKKFDIKKKTYWNIKEEK